MTPDRAIEMADELKPNMMSLTTKYQFLNEVEGMLFQEIIMTHEHEEDIDCPVYAPPADPSETRPQMLAAAPYDMLYVYWIISQIDHLNQEMDKYNSDRSLFENAWGNFADYWNRTRMPICRNRQLCT